MEKTIMTFEQWWNIVEQLAKTHDIEWLLGDQASNRDAYDDGLSPKEAIQELYDDVQER